tara:strand:+ start:1385 stop:1579 length:195 start_codon:yes stop_codon:yes gene_type:complete
MKIGKTKTHHKLYVTERELEVLVNVFGEGAMGFEDDSHDIDRAALNRVAVGLGQALAQSLGGKS